MTTSVEELAGVLTAHSPALVLSGAGISTESGIPDYRSPEALARNRTPMRFQDFIRSEASRRHYWARSHVSWRTMRSITPNAGHRAVTELQAAGVVGGVITQNVDGLHQAAGSHDVLELHGNLRQVRCLDCGQLEAMDSFQERLSELNPGFAALQARPNPDGDVELDQDVTAQFSLAGCLNCGGIMKTDVVFFGENVPKPVVDRAWAMLESCASLLVLGSSLTVWSGYRFVEGAHNRNKPVLIVNDGPTRADDLARLKVSERLGPALGQLEALLTRAANGG